MDLAGSDLDLNVFVVFGAADTRAAAGAFGCDLAAVDGDPATINYLC